MSADSVETAQSGDTSRNLWAVSVTSFLTDLSSEMVTNILPLFLANVVGAGMVTIGLIEGVAESAPSFVKLVSGAISDRLRVRKWLAVMGYGLSAVAKPGFYFATSWGAIAGVRWVERLGKGVRTAPRDALIADSTRAKRRGFAFGLHRAADTAGAVGGLLAAIGIMSWSGGSGAELDRVSFQWLVLASLVPALLAVLVLALVARDVPKPAEESAIPRSGSRLRDLGPRFGIFLAIVALFDLGNSSDAFLVLRAQERGLSVVDVLWTLVIFNAVYALTSLPMGRLSDRMSRKGLIAIGWLLYSVVYFGFGLAQSPSHIVILYVGYGVFHGLAAGTTKAFVADLCPEELRGTAYGAYHAVLGLIDLPASLVAGVLWQGAGSWQGFGAGAPFFFGAATALAAAALLVLCVRDAERP